MARIPLYLYMCLLYLMTLTYGLLESVDVLKPIVKISPARSAGTTDDSFGYSVTAHQLLSNFTGMSLQDVLNNTVIMVGAPQGRYPGGLYPNANTNLSRLACNISYSQAEVDAFNDSQVIDLCYQNRTGLVYQCPLSVGTCSAALGNGSATTSDGLLFDRVGDVHTFDHFLSDNASNLHQVNSKNGQQMGATVYSAGDLFVACAPMWTYTRSNNLQPRGHCVYSRRNLTNFLELQPCIREGTSLIQTKEGFCEGGFSVGVSLTDTMANNASLMLGKNVILTGVPGREQSTGGAFFYTNAGTNMAVFDASGYIQVPTVPASLGGRDVNLYMNIRNVEDQEYSYYGYSIASGFLTSQTTKGFLITSPRRTNFTQLGRVYIVSKIDEVPAMYVDGEQFGEYFGHSVAVADLNGDRWDDFIVGAPIYSEQFRNEIGRIIVYWNNGGTSFNKSATITGTGLNGRFGSSITSLGDINNDGFDDIAVSAPFEGSGVVYIFHGQEMNEQGSIINMTVQQRIDGADVVKQVTNLTSVSSFGFSISGSVDVDNNQYRDLVIGAFESQSVFVLRSRPVAVASISLLNITFDEVQLNTFRCKHNGLPVNCFDVEVCTQYYGKGLESGFSTTYQLQEIVQTNQVPRLFFTNDSSLHSIIRNVHYTGINVPFCENVTVLIRNSSDVSNFKLSAELQQIQRNSEPINTNFVVTDDLIPAIDSTASQIELPVDRRCGIDDLCRPDVILKHVNTTYIDSNGNPLSSNRLVIGEVDTVRIYFEYFNNITEDAYNTSLTFTIQKQYFQTSQIRPRSVVTFKCNDTAIDNTTHSVYVCPIVNRIAFEDGTRQLYLNLLLRRNSLIGNEGSLIVPMSIVTPLSSFSNESITFNNHIMPTIPVVAETTYKLEVTSISVQYQGNFTSSSSSSSSSDPDNPNTFLSNRRSMMITITNNGPSQIHSATLTISIPSFSAETGNYYYFYPIGFEMVNDRITCNGSELNPQNYVLSTRRKRDIIYLRTVKRQAVSAATVSLDCSEPSQFGCIDIVCQLTSYTSGSSTVITVFGYIDERFYSGKTNNFLLRTGVRLNITDGITRPINSTNVISNTISVFYVAPTASEDFPWYIVVGPVVATFIFFAVLVLILYFLGFFRRKQIKEITTDVGNEEFEQFAQNPFENASAPAPSAAAAKEKEAAEGTTL